MIPFPEVFAYQEPVDGQVLVATFGGDLRVPGFLDGRRTIVVAVPDDLSNSRIPADLPAAEPVADETSEASTAGELADVGQPARAGDGHGDTVDEQAFDPFDDDPPAPPFGGRQLIDVDAGGRL
jgi:hypothetical protein